MIVWGFPDWPNSGEDRRSIEMRMMSRCFTWFPIGVLGEPYIYHDSGVFYKHWGFYLESVWLWRISGNYPQEMVGLVLGEFYLEGSEYGFNCWRTDKQSVNVDGLFYITLTVAVIPPQKLNWLNLPHHYLCRFQSWLGKFWVDWWRFS